MAMLVTCPQGHQWNPLPHGPGSPAPAKAACPICGATVALPPSAAAAALPSEEATLPPRKGSAETATLPPAAAAPVRAAPERVTVPGYEVRRELGRGGMGVVYQARHLKLNRLVALKMILAGGHAATAELARFKAEAESIARLQHPNIVQIFEVGEHGGLPFFSLEFCPGGSLEKKLNGTPLPPGEAAALVETLAHAMHAAHEAHVIHRDLKPANILLAGDGTPKITDFGLAKNLDDAAGPTQSGSIMGTPSYMAPEQAGGNKAVGPAADVYALGAILYELLAGRPPFKAATPLDTVLQVIGEEPVPPSRLQSGTPRDLETICLKCLHKEPRKRYASAAALAEDLHCWRAGEPILARPAGRLERLLKWAWRRPAAALVGVSLVAAVLLLAGGAYFTARLAEQVKRAMGAEQVANSRADEALTARDRATFQALRAETARNAMQIVHALRAWQRDDVAEAERVLGEVEGAFREAWETRYVRGLCRRKALPLLGDTLGVLSVCFSPDGKCLASANYDGTVKVWDAATGQEQLSLKGHTGSVTSVCFSPDGKRLASASGELNTPGEVKVWDAATGQQALTLKGHTGYWSVVFSPDGKRLASGVGGGVKVWDALTGQEALTLQGHTSLVSSVAFSPDGQRIVSGSWDQTVKVWDGATGKEVLTIKGAGGSMCFSPDGKRLASASGDGTVKVWDAATGKEVLAIKGAGGSMCFSPNGKRLASASGDGTVKVWDAATGQLALSLKGHTWSVRSVCFSPDGKRIASGGGALGNPGEVRVWDAQTGQEALSLKGHTDWVHSVAFSPDGKRLASGSADRTVRVWDAATGQQARALQGHANTVTSVCFSPDGRRFASASEDKTVKVWDAQTGQEVLSLQGHTSWVTSVCFSPDGKRLASASKDKTVKVWEAPRAEGKAQRPSPRH